jgi:putative transposase
LTCHSDAGSQFVRCGERLTEIGAVPSSAASGIASTTPWPTVNRYFEAELIYGPARTNPWSKSDSPSHRKN